ncbi:uncharacterized protein LOC114536555 [Dendronephthya gigantea]|uniref:uncharacterized protein LOC114536555 n=1 Tax=Dendronephthya gigantea TaxID=151771 RepID=UPI00106CA1EA|nr:uncharacterized protein LOC114536555 [Dendronephthya gigantea]
MAALEEHEQFIRSFLSQKEKTLEDLSDALIAAYPEQRGFSVRSIKRFCKENGIRKRGIISDEHLDDAVKNAVSEVGPVYGRKMMKGYLDSKCGFSLASEQRVRNSLARVSPLYQQQRNARTERLTNPHPYIAEYFGHKLHLDQNEKIAMFGVTHVCAIDGYSRFITAFSCMPVKNNVVIYDMFRNIILNEGLFDQIRVDHGMEFVLLLYVQEMLAEFRTNQGRDPHRQTESKKNLVIERFWVEVNARVNYPIKSALRQMEERNLIDMELENVKHSVSSVSLKVAFVGMEKAVRSWNHHAIPGVGRPIDLRNNNNRVAKVPLNMIPTCEEAVARYENDGGKITRFPAFGQDPLFTNPHLQNEREEQFNHINWELIE